MFRTTLLLLCLAAPSFAARQIITLVDHSPRDLSSLPSGLVNADATITNTRNARDLLQAAVKGTLSEPPNVDSPHFAAIIHVVKWKTQSGDGVPQSEASRWYVYAKNSDQDAFAANNRIFGERHVLLMYVYLNLPAGFKLSPRYDVEVSSKLPATLLHLFQLAGQFTAQADTNNKFGVAAFDVPYLPSDMSATPSLESVAASGVATVTKTGDSQVFDNEGYYHTDFSVGIPIRKMSEVKFDNANNTVSQQTVDKRTMFALLDLYPYKKDVKSTAFDLRPYAVVGVGVGSQPLHRILTAVGWGPHFAQFYVGALFNKQQSLSGLQAGATATPAQQAAATSMKFGTQFAFGINIPVARAVSTLMSGSQSNSTTSQAAKSQAKPQSMASGSAGSGNGGSVNNNPQSGETKQ